MRQPTRKRRNVHDRWCVLCERPISRYSEPFSVLGRGPMHLVCAKNYAAALALPERVVWLPAETSIHDSYRNRQSAKVTQGRGET